MTARSRALAAVLTAAVLLAVAVILALVHDRRVSAPPPEQDVVPPAPPAAAAPPLRVEDVVIRKGQSLAKILSGRGFTGQEIDRLRTQVRAQLKPAVDLGKIVAGRVLRFRTDAGGVVQAIDYLNDADGFIRVTRDGAGFKAERIAYLFEFRLAFVLGTIEDNPINSVTEGGESAALAIAMTDLFAWDIDFYTELRRGDSFRMVVEKRFLDGRFVDYGNILAAEFVCRGRRFEAFRYEIPDPAKPGTTKADYYDREGKSVRKEFLRSPLPYAKIRITSRFSLSRLHPIARVYRAHYGVDYGAPVGTPVQATADGVVLSAGWNGGAGNMVHLRHANNYETMYLHLNRIYVKRGERVSGGKIVGLVGSTGESTGPHLDYRIKQGGSYVNPLAWKFQPQAPLPAQYKEGFGAKVSAYDFLMEAPLRLSRK